MDVNYELGNNGGERKKLTPQKVKIINVSLEQPNSKTGAEMKQKFVFECEHPERQETIKISKSSYLKDGKLTVSGLWLTVDDTGKISGNSAIGITMRHYNKKTLKDFKNTSVETTTEENGFLVIKAY